jgi:hypothetical protein
MIPLLINQFNISLDFFLQLSKCLANSDLVVIGLTGIGPIRKISVLDWFLPYWPNESFLYYFDRFDHIKANKSKLINEMFDIYVKLFNVIFDVGIIPDHWLLGNIIPLYKNKGSKVDPIFFIPFTIISCFGKLITSILNTRLNDFSDDFCLICENQGGFRKSYSTTDNLFIC